MAMNIHIHIGGKTRDAAPHENPIMRGEEKGRGPQFVEAMNRASAEYSKVTTSAQKALDNAVASAKNRYRAEVDAALDALMRARADARRTFPLKGK